MRKYIFFSLICFGLGAFLFFTPQQGGAAASVEDKRKVEGGVVMNVAELVTKNITDKEPSFYDKIFSVFPEREEPLPQKEVSLPLLAKEEENNNAKRARAAQEMENPFFLRIGEDPGLWMRHPKHKEQIIGFCQNEGECKTFKTIIQENNCRSSRIEWIQGIEQSFVVVYCQGL